jgi:hypothetical protein
VPQGDGEEVDLGVGGEGSLMRDEGEAKRATVPIPEWVKVVVAIVGGLVTGLGIAETRFVGRVEYLSHVEAQREDVARLIQASNHYSVKEGQTASGLSDLKVDVAEIKADVGWLRQYLDVSKPPPRRNGAKP